jgi:hypothetical protein
MFTAAADGRGSFVFMVEAGGWTSIFTARATVVEEKTAAADESKGRDFDWTRG